VLVDAGRQPDAATVIDAAPAVTGTGFLIVKHKKGGSYLKVTVDGRPIGPTPIITKPKELPAGPHVVELIAPATGEVVTRETITVEPGKTVEVDQH
jgi:hypothetical protein